MNLLDAPKKIGENEYVESFIDWRSEAIEEMLHKMDSDGICFTGYRVLLIVYKDDGAKEYVIFDEKRNPVMTCEDEFEGDLKVILMRMNAMEKLDIRTMAKTREVPRVV